MRKPHPRPVKPAAAAVLMLTLAIPPPAARAQTSLFPERAELSVPSTGVVRVALPAEVVRASGPALGDLRIFDNDGRALPYVIDGAPPAGEQVTNRGPMTPLEARQRAERPEGAAAIYHEVYDLELPPEAPPGGAWTLAMATTSAHFTAEAVVTRVVPEAEAELLTAHSVFRLASGSERLEVPLPPQASGRIRITLRGESGFVSPVFELRSVKPAEAPTFLALGLTIEREERREGKSILWARRPVALVPNALVLHTSQPTVRRYVRVYDTGADGTQAIVGQGEISRLIQAEGELEPLVLPLDPGRGARLRIEIDDLDSQPLPELRVELRIHQPSLVFDPTSASWPLRIYFGGGRALAPSYPEAEALLEAARGEAAAGIGTVLRIEPNPSYSREPALSFAMTAGARADAAAFAQRAKVTIGESPEGLTRIVLPSAASGHQDLRLVDGEGRQWPYIRGLEDEEERVALTARRHRTTPHTSRYRLTLQGGPQTLRALLVDVRAEYLDRAYRILRRDDDGDEEVWSEGRLQRRPGETEPLRLPVHRPGVESFELAITDGDDAPLTPTVEAIVTHPVLFAAAPPGEYQLLFDVPEGVEDRTPPSYEIALARAWVLTVPSVDARVGVVEPNPDFDPPSPYSGSRLADVLLWLVLGFAIAVLGALTFRLARTAPPPEGPSDA